MHITVRLHGVLVRHARGLPGGAAAPPRVAAGAPTTGQATTAGAGASIDLEVTAGTTVGQVRDRLGLEPGLVALLAINGRRAQLADVLQDGDRLTLFPPVAGGEDSSPTQQT